MKCIITSNKEKTESFAVCLLRTPYFPTKLPLKQGVFNMAVIAANDDNGAWGFITLAKEEKDVIGSKLLEVKAEYNKWYWCELYE